MEGEAEGEADTKGTEAEPPKQRVRVTMRRWHSGHCSPHGGGESHHVSRCLEERGLDRIENGIRITHSTHESGRPSKEEWSERSAMKSIWLQYAWAGARKPWPRPLALAFGNLRPGQSPN
jgi:hypothetical protein